MYFKNITLINVGPIENINYEFSFNNDDNPKPLILVGTNGSGKRIFLSHLLNPLMVAQQVTFDNAEVKEGKVYKLRSAQYIRNGSTFSYAKVNFVSDFNGSVEDFAQFESVFDLIKEIIGDKVKIKRHWDK